MGWITASNPQSHKIPGLEEMGLFLSDGISGCELSRNRSSLNVAGEGDASSSSLHSQTDRNEARLWHRLGLEAASIGCSLWCLGGPHASEEYGMLVCSMTEK